MRPAIAPTCLEEHALQHAGRSPRRNRARMPSCRTSPPSAAATTCKHWRTAACVWRAARCGPAGHAMPPALRLLGGDCGGLRRLACMPTPPHGPAAQVTAATPLRDGQKMRHFIHRHEPPVPAGGIQVWRRRRHTPTASPAGGCRPGLSRALPLSACLSSHPRRWWASLPTWLRCASHTACRCMWRASTAKIRCWASWPLSAPTWGPSSLSTGAGGR